MNATSKDFDRVVLSERDRLVVAYFWGQNCPNCEAFARHFPRLEERLRNRPVLWAKVDAYTESDLATRFGLHGIPTFVLFARGVAIGRMTSFQGEEFFVQVVEEQLAKRGFTSP